MHIHGQGKKERELPLEKKPLQALHLYRDHHRPESGHLHFFLNYKGEGLSIRGVRKIVDKYVKKAGITKQNLLQHHDALRVDDAAFAFLALNGNLLALVQIFDHQGDDLFALTIEHERVLIDADGGGFDIPIILCPVGTRDDIRLGTLGMNGNADHGDLTSVLS